MNLSFAIELASDPHRFMKMSAAAQEFVVFTINRAAEKGQTEAVQFLKLIHFGRESKPTMH